MNIIHKEQRARYKLVPGSEELPGSLQVSGVVVQSMHSPYGKETRYAFLEKKGVIRKNFGKNLESM